MKHSIVLKVANTNFPVNTQNRNEREGKFVELLEHISRLNRASFSPITHMSYFFLSYIYIRFCYIILYIFENKLIYREYPYDEG